MDYIAMIASVPGVVAVVNLLKQLGVTGKWSLVAAIVVGVALNVANFYLGDMGVYQAGVQGAMIGLGAAGIYDLSASPKA
jgi:hypothetical protein